MFINNILHKGLRRFLLYGDESGLPSQCLDKIKLILTFLQDMEAEEDLLKVPSWRAHRLSGSLRGHWSLHVTRNWRLTFRIDAKEIVIIDLDFQDYH